MSETTNEIIIRKILPANDLALIYSSFLNSYIKDALRNRPAAPLPSAIKNVDRRIFYDFYSKELDRILRDPTTEVNVACWSKEPDEI